MGYFHNSLQEQIILQPHDDTLIQRLGKAQLAQCVKFCTVVDCIFLGIHMNNIQFCKFASDYFAACIHYFAFS